MYLFHAIIDAQFFLSLAHADRYIAAKGLPVMEGSLFRLAIARGYAVP